MADLVHFRSLLIANEQRSSYGLRYQDYDRYRKHCANRTHRLRSTLKMTHGKGREFKKLPPLKPEAVRAGHLELYLMEAERAWAYAQDLNIQSLQPANDDKASSLRHQATGRFRRAINWSTQLLSFCQTLYHSSKISARDLLECTVYTLILNGRFLRYRDDFEDALVQLCVARNLLDELASTATTSRDQALATLFGDEIAPEIRHCAHEMGHEKAYDVDGIVTSLASKHKHQFVDGCNEIVKKLKQDEQSSSTVRKQLEPLIWEEKPVPVRSPELVDVLLKIQEAEKKLSGQASEFKPGSKKAVAAFDAILLALSDAEDVGRRVVEAQQTGGGGVAGAAGTRDIHFVHAFIVYQLLTRRIQRDLLLVQALLTPATSPAPTASKSKDDATDVRVYPAVVKLFDTVLQSLNQMRTLSIADDSPDLATAVESRITYTKARRCFYLSRCYTPLKKYPEALTLLQHASIHVRETQSLLGQLAGVSSSAEEQQLFQLNPDLVGELEADVGAENSKVKRAWFAYNGGSPTLDPNDYKKPLFFNIALNYVELDLDRLKARAGKQPDEAKKQPTALISTKQSSPQVQTQKPGKIMAEDNRPTTPTPSAQPQKGGLSSLLGGWWGRS